MAGLTRLAFAVMRIVNRYIGVSGGYLGDFSYRTHADFYPEFCDLGINPNDLDGTTRERFIVSIEGATPLDQAKMVRGVTERFPVGQFKSPPPRTEALREELLKIAKRLESGVVESLSPRLRPTWSREQSRMQKRYSVHRVQRAASIEFIRTYTDISSLFA